MSSPSDFVRSDGMRTAGASPASARQRPTSRGTPEPEAEVAPIFDSQNLEADPFQGPGDLNDQGPPKEEEIEDLFVDLIDEER